MNKDKFISREEINNSIDEMFNKAHSAANTSYGDITPTQSVQLSKIIDELQDLINKQVEQNLHKVTLMYRDADNYKSHFDIYVPDLSVFKINDEVWLPDIRVPENQLTIQDVWAHHHKSLDDNPQKYYCEDDKIYYDDRRDHNILTVESMSENFHDEN